MYFEFVSADIRGLTVRVDPRILRPEIGKNCIDNITPIREGSLPAGNRQVPYEGIVASGGL